jgi:benzodiazapine receptor
LVINFDDQSLHTTNIDNGNANDDLADKTKKQYRELKQPPLNPPAYVFAPVWTLLYAGMGYASHRAWTAGMDSSFDAQAVADAKVFNQFSVGSSLLNSFLLQHGATLYTIQLGLNLIWMPLFFGFQRPKEAVADIVALVGTTSYLVYVWSKVDTAASWLMVPYLGWLSFATYLTVSHDSHHIYHQNQLTC